METLERQVRRARRRLFWQSLAGKLAWCWFVTLLVAAVAIAAGKWWPLADQRTWAAAWMVGALVVGLVGAVAWSWLRRRGPLAAAVEIDRRFALKERVSSTLALSAEVRESDIGQALVRDAERRVGQVELSEGFRLRLDRRALLPLLSGTLAFALAVAVPVRSPETPAQAAAVQPPAAKKATQTLAKKLAEKRKEAIAEGLAEAEAISKLEEGVRQLSESSENDRKKTLLALNELVKDAERRRHDLSGAAELKKQLENLKNLKQGPAERLGQALKQGNLDQALAEIEKLKQELAGDQLDEEARQALAEQLDQLQQALAQKAAAHEQLARDLQQQIEAQRRAGNHAAADKLQDQLDKLAAQRPHMEQLGQMAQQLQQAAQCLGDGDCQQAADALAQLADQLAGMQGSLQEMEALDEMLADLADSKKAMACQECEGDGCGACQGDQWAKRFGPLRHVPPGGGEGIGVGVARGIGPETNPEGKFYDSSVKQQAGRGGAKVVGQADGPNRKGQVREAIRTEFAESQQDAADPLSEQRLPRDYRDHARGYFDALREGTR